MKKIALISGLLFLVVYFWVNTFIPEENAFDVVYPYAPARTSSVIDNPVSPVKNNQDLIEDDASLVDYNYLIVASFSDLEQARRVADELAGRYNADMFVLPPASNGYYRISHGRYTSTEEALAALETLKQTYCPDAWLLPSK
ncbi:MAG: SPOR domain-containing protein [Bacteroidales bacterium]|jgi:hypothetical protein|nr:SPOR domain-containing protein [Bacteroidales bacterium]